MPFFDPIRIGSSGTVADYTVDRSLRFNDNDTAYLSRDFGSGGNRKKWTFSAWIKRGNLGGQAGEQRIFGGDTNASHIFFASNDELTWDVAAPGSSASANLNTEQKFRDPLAWFHLVCAFDTDNSTADNRMRIYINGTEVTSFGTRTNPSSGYALNAINADGDRATHTLGYRTSAQGSAGMEFDGYMAEINFIDGQQYDPSYFTETNSTTGQLIPKKYTGSYGTTGFYLNFSDNSGTSSTTLGKDSSGNGNNFTPNNFSVSAGAGNDSVTDTPTNNFYTFNKLNTIKYNANYDTIVEEGSLLMRGADNVSPATMTYPRSGKWYCEFSKYGNGFSQGVSVVRADTDIRNLDGVTSHASKVTLTTYPELLVRGSSVSNNGTAWENDANAVIGVAVDMDNGAMYFAINNTWINSGDPTSGSSKTGAVATDLLTVNNGYHYVAAQGFNGNDNAGMYANFGQIKMDSTSYADANGHGTFKYSVPSGYLALCSANLPDPTILLPDKHFDTLLYSGTGSSQNITGLEFKPDWVWIKKRNGSDNHNAADTVRGAGLSLRPNTGGAETSSSGAINAFLSNGFTVVDAGETNENGYNYVAWNWDAGETDGKTYSVKVVSDSGNKYRFDDFGTSAVTLDLAEGGTYIFDQSDSSNSGHPLRFYTAADKSGGEYTTGVTTSGTAGSSGATVTITIAASAPTLYYQCSNHAGMGGQINTNSTLGSSNFDGAIQSVVKANTTAGFSIVLYSGSGSNTTVGHGLGVAPSFYVCKTRNGANFAEDWVIYHQSLGATKNVRLHTDVTSSTQSVMFNNTEPTSTVFSLGTNNNVNGSGGTFVAYCFSEVENFSKFGSYQANGNSDGPFIYTGFRPAWILIKNTDLAQPWVLMDYKINPYNLADTRLSPSSSAAELTSGDNYVDILSNGFKVRSGSSTDINYSDSYPNHIYFAFAESPFKNARAR